MKRLILAVVITFLLSAPIALAGPLAGLPCNGNFDGDEDVDAIDVAEFLIHFGRSPFLFHTSSQDHRHMIQFYTRQTELRLQKPQKHILSIQQIFS